MRHFLMKLRERAPWPMDVIRVDGTLHAVVQVDYSEFQTASTEPLATLLARHILVASGELDQVTMANALIEAGWKPPHVVDEHVERLQALQEMARLERARHEAAHAEQLDRRRVARARFEGESERLLNDLWEALDR